MITIERNVNVWNDKSRIRSTNGFKALIDRWRRVSGKIVPVYPISLDGVVDVVIERMPLPTRKDGTASDAFQCASCDKVFASKKQLTVHQYLQHAAKLECKDCGKSFKTDGE